MINEIKNKIHILHNIYIKHKYFIKKKSYSMDGEDLFISDYFKDRKLGFYVDVGCYHPLDGNNTYLLHKKGWKGINLDINKLSIELFNVARKKDFNVNVAVSNKSKRVKVYYRKKINMLNTIDKKFAKVNFKKGFNTKTIYSNSLDSILEKSKYRNKKIDFLNIDIEGNEINALKSFNFTKYKPKLVCIEIHNLKTTKNNVSYYKESPIYKFLNKKSYKLLWNNGFSFIFKNK